MDGGGGSTVSSTSSRPAAAANTNSSAAGMKRSEPDGTGGGWTGTKKTKKSSQEHQDGGCAANPTAAAARSRKRPYEQGEDELDVSMEKLFKCNYWEDPAYASKLQFFGLELARDAAHDHLCERVHREHEAFMAEVRSRRSSA